MIHELGPLLEQGKIKLYCVESNVAEAWTNAGADPRWKAHRHNCYEQFVMNVLVPFVRHDCQSSDIRIAVAGASLGAMYAANLALKNPEVFWWALCLSGRYEVRSFTGGFDNHDVYFNNPLAYTWNLHGHDLDRVRRTSLTLVCGQGAYEDRCIDETVAMAKVLGEKEIPVELDLWGHDVSHEWHWWRRQVVHHVGRRVG